MALSDFLKAEKEKQVASQKKADEMLKQRQTDNEAFKTQARLVYAEVIMPALTKAVEDFNANNFKASLNQEIQRIGYSDESNSSISVHFKGHSFQFDFHTHTFSKVVEVSLYVTLEATHRVSPRIGNSKKIKDFQLDGLVASDIENVIEQTLTAYSQKSN